MANEGKDLRRGGSVLSPPIGTHGSENTVGEKVERTPRDKAVPARALLQVFLSPLHSIMATRKHSTPLDSPRKRLLTATAVGKGDWSGKQSFHFEFCTFVFCLSFPDKHSLISNLGCWNDEMVCFLLMLFLHFSAFYLSRS